MAAGTVARVAFLDDYQDVALDLSDLPPGVAAVSFSDHVADPARLATRLAGFDVIVCMRERTAITASLLRALPDLKLLITTGMANAAIDVPAARARGVTVCGTSAPLAYASTTEHTLGLMLALARRIPAQDAAVRAGGWQQGVATHLGGRTLGLVGLGNLGAAMVPLAVALGMNVIAWSENLTGDRAEAVGATLVSREELFRVADVISVHLVLSERSRSTVGTAELALMKPSALLINTSRGPIVDEAALIEALREGRIAGAALDVFDTEPLPAVHPLRYLPNTVLAPHTGYISDLAYQQWYREISEDIAAFIDGHPIRELA
jgi:phosphoglycerate dehydrogenase-like enzyme